MAGTIDYADGDVRPVLGTPTLILQLYYLSHCHRVMLASSPGMASQMHGDGGGRMS
jgi:hypothetical protein